VTLSPSWGMDTETDIVPATPLLSAAYVFARWGDT
jgi:hypothetical protein